ncbi:Gliding motility-associated protein GldM [uncultured Paludibacter sp.]|nr:Gliding motility-associated protein GldM [uncultured Paludibacter sp.]
MSGSKNCPETPRQRMIGMMYLVLTAMLALNVSNEVLEGFGLVDRGLRNTIESSEKRNDGMYKNFKAEEEKNPQKVKEWLEKATKVKLMSDELFNYIKDYKYQIVKIADGKNADKNAVDIQARENIDAAGEYSKVKGNDKILKKKIDIFRDSIMAMTKDDPAKQAMFAQMFDTKNKGGKTWSDRMFESMPVAAVVTMLSKYQSDIRSAEAETVQYLRAKADLQDFNLNKLTVVVNAESSYVLQGGTYKAQIFLAAYDENKVNEYQYKINGSSLGNNNIIQIGASGIGPHTYVASVVVPKNDGTWEEYKSEPYQYIVGKPSATMSNVDLNVVYRGIDNRFKISVPGVPDGSVRVSASGASISKSGDFYVIKPQQDEDITINVSAEINGRVVNMGSEKYRVKYLPDPTAYFQYTDAGGVPRAVREEKLSKRLLKSASTIVANYGPDALIKANFTVTSFTLSALGTSIPTSGSRFNSRQLDLINELEGGDDVFIKNIRAVGPDGKERKLGTISIQL